MELFENGGGTGDSQEDAICKSLMSVNPASPDSSSSGGSGKDAQDALIAAVKALQAVKDKVQAELSFEMPYKSSHISLHWSKTSSW